MKQHASASAIGAGGAGRGSGGGVTAVAAAGRGSGGVVVTAIAAAGRGSGSGGVTAIAAAAARAAPRRQRAPRRTAVVVAAKAKATPSQVVAAPQVIFEATGVPLVDEMMRLRTVPEAATLARQLAAAAVVGTALASLALRAADGFAARRGAQPHDRRRGGGGGGGGGKRGINLIATAAAAAFRPLQRLLPYGCAAYVLTVGASLAEVAATKLKKEFAALACGREAEVLGAIKFVAQFLQDCTELIGVVLLAWTLIDFKTRVLRWLANAILSDDEHPEQHSAVIALLLPLGGVLNAAVVAAATAVALKGFGLNIAPLLASVGGVGLVLGLAAQRSLGNIVSALMLFAARPFIAGDEVRLLASGTGAEVIRGRVTIIEPLRTIMRTDDGGLAYVSNAEVVGHIIINLTQGAALDAVKRQTAAAAAAAAAASADADGAAAGSADDGAAAAAAAPDGAAAPPSGSPSPSPLPSPSPPSESSSSPSPSPSPGPAAPASSTASQDDIALRQVLGSVLSPLPSDPSPKEGRASDEGGGDKGAESAGQQAR